MAGKHIPYFPIRPTAAGWLEMLLLPLDRWFNRLYTARYNPLYQSGTMALLFLLVTVATGLYQLVFYKISTPYESVAGLEAQWYAGRWIRAMHSYAGDAMLVSVAVHVLRMLVQGKTWGVRLMAWLTGVLLTGILFFSAWTGIVLVWDLQGFLMAYEGAKLIDVFPLFSEPIQRAFTRPGGADTTFFFINLLLHMVFPVCILLLVWLHTIRVARPRFLPPLRLTLWTVAVLTGLSIVRPLGMMPKADPLLLLGEVEVDIFYTWWVALTWYLPPWATLAVWLALGVLVGSIPWWWRASQGRAPEAASINPLLCTGCSQCYKDCPYGAVRMVPTPEGDDHAEKVAQIDPVLCVACGICAGSCAPMLMGPPGRKGRDHLVDAQRFFAERDLGANSVVVMACSQGALSALSGKLPADFHFYPLHCAGSMHSSAIEYLIRRGLAGVYLLACPERDCVYREGVRWMSQRIYEDREAELLDRVDKRRVRIGAFAVGEAGTARADLLAFQAEMMALDTAPEDQGPDMPDPECEIPMAGGD